MVLRIDCPRDDPNYRTVGAQERYRLAIQDDGMLLTAGQRASCAGWRR